MASVSPDSEPVTREPLQVTPHMGPSFDVAYDGDGGGPVDGEPPVDEGDEPGEGEGKRRKRDSFWRELPVLILIALGIAVLIKTFAFQAFYIPSPSMEDTLRINDRVLVNKLSYRFGDIERGDIVVFDDPNAFHEPESIPAAVLRHLLESVGLSTPDSEVIKRVIGLPGDSVAVSGGKVHVNDEPIDEPYLHPATAMADYGPVVVEPGQVFVMGDNRNASRDSRFFGTVPMDTVIGRAFVILWPPSHWSGL